MVTIAMKKEQINTIKKIQIIFITQIKKIKINNKNNYNNNYSEEIIIKKRILKLVVIIVKILITKKTK